MQWWTGVMFGVAACGEAGTPPPPRPPTLLGAPIDELELPSYRALAPAGWSRALHPDKASYQLIATGRASSAISIRELTIAPDELRDGVSDARCVTYATRTGAILTTRVGTSKVADFGALIGCDLELSDARSSTRELVLFSSPDHGVRIECVHDRGSTPAIDDDACVALARSIMPSDFPGKLVRTLGRGAARVTVPLGWVLVTDPTMTAPGMDTLMHVPHDPGFHPIINVQSLPMGRGALTALKTATLETCTSMQAAQAAQAMALGPASVWDHRGFHGCELETIANDPDEEAIRTFTISDGTSAFTIMCVRAKVGDPATDAACNAVANSATGK